MDTNWRNYTETVEFGSNRLVYVYRNDDGSIKEFSRGLLVCGPSSDECCGPIFWSCERGPNGKYDCELRVDSDKFLEQEKYF